MSRIHRLIPGKQGQRLKLIALSILAFIIVCFIAVYRNAFTASLALATTMQPETYTALYVDNSATLPEFSPAKRPEAITFHIANHEAVSMTYTYNATMQIGTVTTVLAKHSISLADGEISTDTIHFTLPEAGLKAVITIALDGRTEHLVFRTQS